jgi:hypothetical protein
VELLEGGAGSFEAGEFHLRIFAGEDDAVRSTMEGGDDGIADTVGRALAVSGLGGSTETAGPSTTVASATYGRDDNSFSG